MVRRSMTGEDSMRLCRKSPKTGKLKLANHRFSNTPFSDFASERQLCDRTLMPRGAPRPMKIGRLYALPEEHDRMPPKGLGVRSCSDWCPEPVTELDLDTCRHHELSPASWGKWSTQGSLSCSGYPASPL